MMPLDVSPRAVRRVSKDRLAAQPQAWDRHGRNGEGRAPFVRLSNACRSEWNALPGRSTLQDDEDGAESRITYSDSEEEAVDLDIPYERHVALEEDPTQRADNRSETSDQDEELSVRCEPCDASRDALSGSDREESDGSPRGEVDSDAEAQRHYSAATRGLAAASRRPSEQAQRCSSFRGIHKRHRALFPVRGVTCVPCLIGSRMQPVDAFIRTNLTLLSEVNLFRMAAHVYKTSIADEAVRNGCAAPPVPWKCLREHYKWHTLDRRMQLVANVRELQLMKGHAQQELVRRVAPEEGVDEETNVDEALRLELDTKRVDVYLKLLAAQERTMASLASADATNGERVSSGGGGGSWSKD